MVWEGKGIGLLTPLFFAFNALLIRKEDLGMIRGANLAEMLGGGLEEMGVQLNIK